jgi:hypothetical protein
MSAFEPLREINFAKGPTPCAFDKEFAQRVMSWRIKRCGPSTGVKRTLCVWKISVFGSADGRRPYCAIYRDREIL